MDETPFIFAFVDCIRKLHEFEKKKTDNRLSHMRNLRI